MLMFSKKLIFSYNQRENTDNVFTLKFDNKLIHSNIKTNSTLLKTRERKIAMPSVCKAEMRVQRPLKKHNCIKLVATSSLLLRTICNN